MFGQLIDFEYLLIDDGLVDEDLGEEVVFVM
jgi:hypothetical protein